MKWAIHSLATVVSAAACARIVAGALADDTPERLAPGSVVEREMAAGETHRYQVELQAGSYLQVLIEQRGADVDQVLSGPDGREVIATSSPCGPIGPNPLAVVVPAAGLYELRVKSRNPPFAPNRYELRVEALHEPTAVDRLRARAVRANAEAQASFQAQPAEGRARFREALAAWEELGERRMALWTHQMLGYVAFRSFDEYEEAQERYSRALAMALEQQDEYAEARLSTDLGQVLRRLGRLDEAKALLERSLALHRAGGRENFTGRTLIALGAFFRLAGEPQAALDRFHEALPIFQALHAARGEAQVRLEAGMTYLALDEPELALEQLQLALPGVSREPVVRAECITQIGVAHFRLGDLDRAREAYSEALAIYKTLGNRVLEADTSVSLAELHQRKGDLQAARGMLDSALAVYREQAYPLGESLAHCRRGEVLRALDDAAAARAAFEAAAAVAAKANVGGCPQAGLARLARDQGALDEAQALAEAALVQAESVRSRVAGHLTRAPAQATSQPLYDLLIDVLMRRHEARPAAGHAAAAFEASERARARSLLQLLGDARLDVREGATPELLAEERSLHWRLNAAAAAQAEASGAGRAEKAAAMGRELDSLAAQLAETEARIRRTSPHYAALTQARPLALGEIRSRVLDADTQLLEYALGDERSTLWVVSADRLETFRLAPRREIEAAARTVHERLAAVPATGGAESVESARRELGRLVLRPAKDALKARRLLIVAPGALQYVPLGALPLADGGPLLEHFEVVSAPSASVIAILRQERGDSHAAKAVAVLADPVFERSDPRLAQARPGTVSVRAAAAPDVSPPPLEAALRGRSGLSRLPFSRQEADAISALSPRGGTLRAMGFAASRQTATSGALAGFRIVHFATHGVLDTSRPELSGVVLSLFDAKGRPLDGFLRLHDVYNLRLDADLVVLSGCQTGLGKEMGGEGLVGLTRGFMYAGARSVVASLWQVDDESTAELMKRFYRVLLKEKRTPAEALRAAQLELARTPRWSAPFYWAGFVLEGEWR